MTGARQLVKETGTGRIGTELKRRTKFRADALARVVHAVHVAVAKDDSHVRAGWFGDLDLGFPVVAGNVRGIPIRTSTAPNAFTARATVTKTTVIADVPSHVELAATNRTDYNTLFTSKQVNYRNSQEQAGMATTSRMASAQGRLLPAGEYGFSDIEIGDHYSTSGVTVTEAHVVGFAGLSGDLFDVHMDDDFARGAGFPGRIAHGLLGLAMADGLKTRCAVRLKAIATLGWNWSFRAPLLPGDRIYAEVSVATKRQTRREDRGIVTLEMKVLNQRYETIQDGQTQLLMQR